MKRLVWIITGVFILGLVISIGCSTTPATWKTSVPVTASSTVAMRVPTQTEQPPADWTILPTSTAQPSATLPTSIPPSPMLSSPSSTPTRIAATQTVPPILVTARTDVNVRSGPGVNYPVIGTLRKGEQRPLRGKNPDGTWLQIDYRGGTGWVSSSFAVVSGDARPVTVAVSSRPTLTATPRPSPTVSNRVLAYVSRVIDGDTITVLLDGRSYNVRYIGIDAPETVAPGRPVEWMGREATAANKALVEGKMVYLEKDVSNTDRYGRLLRYVYVGQVFVNAELVRQGYAVVSTYPPDVKYQSLFLQMQQEARAAGRGLWGAQPPSTQPTVVVRPTATVPQPGRCDPSYPDVCIPPPPPDLDCKDIPYRRFRVRPPDPHRFDGDYDGIGCER
jgi:micrococcal nuclease